MDHGGAKEAKIAKAGVAADFSRPALCAFAGLRVFVLQTPLYPPNARSNSAALAADTSPEGVKAAAQLAAEAAKPIDDIRASAAYRRAMVAVLTRRGIEAILNSLALAGLRPSQGTHAEGARSGDRLEQGGAASFAVAGLRPSQGTHAEGARSGDRPQQMMGGAA